jgi:hypothetical protein
MEDFETANAEYLQCDVVCSKCHEHTTMPAADGTVGPKRVVPFRLTMG